MESSSTARARTRLSASGGFTLVELVVVLLILTALIAIAIAVYGNQVAKGQDACVKEQLNTARTANEAYYTERQYYAPVGAQGLTDLNEIEAAVPAAPTSGCPGSSGFEVTDGGGQTYSIRVISASNRTFQLTRDGTGAFVRTCGASATPPSANGGGCPDGRW